MILRSAGDADRDTIARVWLDGWRSTGIVLADEPDYAGLRARVDDETASGWQVTVAERAGTIVGFVALRPDRAKLDQIFVAPEAHGRGIGQALFAVARAALPGGFTLWTHGENARAQHFYAALGPVRQEDGVHPRHGHPIVTYWFAGARRPAGTARVAKRAGHLPSSSSAASDAPAVAVHRLGGRCRGAP